jgi:hypothetical protein
MPFVVLSYLRDGNSYDSYGNEFGWDADLDYCGGLETTAAVAEYIAKRIRHLDGRYVAHFDRADATWAHLVFDDWEDLNAGGAYRCIHEGKGEDSIDMPGVYDEEATARRDALVSEIRALVRSKLGEFSEEAKRERLRKEKEEAAARAAEAARRTREGELKQLAYLKSKYPDA